ncbi:MAG: hypothetical protein F6K23_21715 [Okeania sp. SIO2C9]|uniref:hypothetical protein n=1 Tax=Okeania sp. SIO2C9 TaxID=2607791 RepID=UPI0013C0F6EB|nr:hypothetical protein [Okeania sp. SIO2C9]NEQ75436.1 hypothetical protein [Okeania sp. SIO2C9]
MSNSTNSENPQNVNTSGNTYGVTQEGDIFQNFFGKTDFDEISFEDLESQTKELPEIQPDFLNQLKEHRMLVLGGELGGINKNELILQLAYLVAQDSQKTDSDKTNPQKADVSIKLWRHSSSQQIIDLELELRNRKSPTIFVFTDIEPKDINCSLQHIYDIVPSLEHWVLFSTNRSFSSWHLNDNAQIFFNPNLNPQDIYGQDILVNELEKKLGKNLKLELNKYLKNDAQGLKSIAEQLGDLGNILRFVKLFDRKIQESQTDININDLIKESKSDEFVRNLFQNILSDRQQLMALGISFFNGMFEDQLFTALEKVFTEAWRKRDPSLIALDYSDLEELIYNYFDFQENNLYEGVSNIFKVVETKTYKIDIRSINILSLGNRDQLFEIAWQSHRRQIINALEVLVNIVKESALEKNYYLLGELDLYRNPIRCEKVRKAITNTFSSIGVVSINAVYSSLLQLARHEKLEVRDVAASVIASWYELDKKEELFRILQYLYNFSLEKEKASQQLYEEVTEEDSDNVENQDKSNLKESEKQLNQNKIDLARDKFYESYQSLLEKNEEVKKRSQEEEEYYINKKQDLHDYIGATVAVTLGDVIYEYHKNKAMDDKLYDWLQELSKSRLRFVHFYFGYYTLFWVVPLHLEKMRDLLKEIVQDHKDWLSEKPDLSLNKATFMSLYNADNHPKISLSNAVARSLTHAYNYPENREQVKDILKSWYREGSNVYPNNKSKNITEKEALLRTVALTYGLIKYDDERFPILLEDACSCLAEILKMDNHPLVRKIVIFTVFVLTNEYFDKSDKIEEWLSDLVSNFNRTEQKNLVIELTAIYIKERVQSKKINELTTVEKAMNKWAKQENVPAQQIAIKALVSFAKLPE